MNNTIRELQFCQLENEELRKRLEEKKQTIQKLYSDVKFLLGENDALFSTRLEDGAIILTADDREKLLTLIRKVI
jgi:hypothetical protein